MRLPQDLVSGTFVRRRNRFAADVLVNGQPAIAHVPNSGRMAELLVAGAPVLLEPAPANLQRRTSHTLALVMHGGQWVGVDSRLPPALVVEAWRQGLLPLPGTYDRIQREVRFGDSRLDLCFQGPDGSCYVETKSVNLVVDGVALFPDAPTRRGARHLGDLAGAVSLGHGAAVVFVVQRDDARAVAPHETADPRFARELGRVAKHGVGVYAVACRVTSRSITPVRKLPVSLDQPVGALEPGPRSRALREPAYGRREVHDNVIARPDAGGPWQSGGGVQPTPRLLRRPDKSGSGLLAMTIHTRIPENLLPGDPV